MTALTCFFLAKTCYIMLSRNNMLIFFGDAYFDESVSFFLILALLIGLVSEECMPATSSLKITSKELLFLFLYPYKDRRKTQNLLVLGMQARLNGSVCFVTESCHHYHYHHIHQHRHNHYSRTASAVVARQSSGKLK